jgi:hypothetical protein
MGKCPDQGYLTVNATIPNSLDVHGVQKNWARNVSNSINSAAFGFNPLTAINDDLRISFDMRSVAVALAVNMNILAITELLRVPMNDNEEAANVFPYEYCNHASSKCNGLNVTDWAAFYAPRYIGMAPLYCVGVVNAFNTTEKTRFFCFIRSGNMILYPTMNHREEVS